MPGAVGGEIPQRLNRVWDQEHDKFIAARLLELIEPEFTTPPRGLSPSIDSEGSGDGLGVTPNAPSSPPMQLRVLRPLREEIAGLTDE